MIATRDHGAKIIDKRVSNPGLITALPDRICIAMSSFSAEIGQPTSDGVDSMSFVPEMVH
jgi:hypothetical protein